MDFLRFSLADFNQCIKDESESDAVGNVVSEAHDQRREESRYGFGEFAPIDVLETARHQNADDDQCRGGGGAGNDRGDRSQEHAKEEKHSGENGSKSGPASGFDAGGRFDVSCCVGGTEEGADGSGDRVSEQGFFHFGFETFAVFDGFDIFVGEDAASSSGTDEGSDCIKGVGKAQSEDCKQRHR